MNHAAASDESCGLRGTMPARIGREEICDSAGLARSVTRSGVHVHDPFNSRSDAPNAGLSSHRAFRLPLASLDSTVLGGVARFMDSIPERFSLLGGPYQPPRVRADGYLRCAMRGWTKVDGYTEAPIPWPAKWGRSPILCGDLIRAVGREAKATVAYHWGVSVITVYKWRKFLGVLEWNEGSSDLLRYARRKAGHRKGSVAKAVFKNSYSLVKAANPRRRSREFVEMMREITCERLKQVGVLDPRRRAWTPEEDRLLGVFSDAEVAVRTRRSRRAVMSRRRRMRQKCPTSSWTHWSPDQINLLGTKPD